MSKFETTDGSSAGTTSRQTYKLTHSHGLSVTEREKLVHSSCTILDTQFEDTIYGVVQTTAIADFKMWPLEETELEGISLQLFIIISAFHYSFVWYLNILYQWKCLHCRFEDDCIAIILNHFTAYVDNAGEVKAEWPLLQCAVFDVYVY